MTVLYQQGDNTILAVAGDYLEASTDECDCPVGDGSLKLDLRLLD